MALKRLEEIKTGSAGGKADGLQRLHTWGYPIPETFVITRPEEKYWKKDIVRLPEKKKFAVRSSATAEDGQEHSFAGQFETILNVQGHDALISAVKRCFSSHESQRVSHYHRQLKVEEDAKMYVLVQEMVDAQYSGVLFTADPVENRYDRCRLTLAEGLGEHLMAGKTSGYDVVFYKQKPEVSVKDLPDDVLQKLIAEALAIEKKFGKPADLEFAIDNENRLYWLQLRPVTRLSAVHLNELDDSPLFENPIYTRGNIGEMMPGPVTPLTLSTFGRAIDVGLQEFYQKCGALKNRSEKNRFVHSFYYHLFFDVNSLYRITRYVLLAKKENIDFSVVGRRVPGVVIDKKEVSFFTALLNFLRMYRYTAGATKAARALQQLYAGFHIQCPDDPLLCWELINKELPVLFRAYGLHYVTSSRSGSYFSALLNLLSGGKPPEREHQQLLASYFTNIADIESAQVVNAVDHLSALLAREEDAENRFLNVSVDEAIQYLEKDAPEKIRQSWNSFLERHGHRCVREAEMREKEWALHPEPVVESIRMKVQWLRRKQTEPEKKPDGSVRQPGLPLTGFRRRIFYHLLPKARKAVAQREQTKAWAVGVQYQFKKAYRALAEWMTRAGLLDDEDLIYFLKHDEIGRFLKGTEAGYWHNMARQRRALFPVVQQLSFSDLIFGIPVPDEPAEDGPPEGVLSGIPVSQGKVTGKVRIVRTMEDARQLRKGEIMVSQYTDIGWTPFYSIIKGLVTEIGSPLSHGAVVAREYGIPAVVGMKGVLSVLQTGQEITLDAGKGIVSF